MLLHNVKIDVLNDSKETIAAMCLSGVIMLSAAPALFILANSINYLTLTWVLENFFLAMVHLSLTFIPKVCKINDHLIYMHTFMFIKFFMHC